MNSLSIYKKNITSQWGEDGIVEEILGRIGKTDVGTCVEFGAWDGKHMSNTYNLWHNKNWSAILIEGDKRRFIDLKIGVREYPKVIPYHAFVEETGFNSLDSILKNLKKEEIDLLSIDIDGDDYYIFKSLSTRPTVLILEYNPTTPPHLSVISSKGEYFGSSAKAIIELGREKRYSLAAITDTNCIFVKDEEFPKLNITQPNLEEVFPRKHLTYLISSYDGVSFVDKTPPYSKVKKLNRRKGISFLNKTNLVPISFRIRVPISERFKKTYTYIKNRLKKIPGLMIFYKKIWTVYTVQKWKLNGMPVPAPHKIKEDIVIEFGKKIGAKNLVETGTYMGEMIDATKKHFERVISIELDTTLASKANQKFLRNKNVTILQGDSGALLPTIIKDLSGKTIFWLDAHYSGGITAKGDQYTPIISEVETIASYPQKDTTLLVDDARLFTGKDEYPLLSDFKKLIKKLFPKHEFEVRDDVIRIYQNHNLIDHA
jgi:hypothetical protein